MLEFIGVAAAGIVVGWIVWLIYRNGGKQPEFSTEPAPIWLVPLYTYVQSWDKPELPLVPQRMGDDEETRQLMRKVMRDL